MSRARLIALWPAVAIAATLLAPVSSAAKPNKTHGFAVDRVHFDGFELR